MDTIWTVGHGTLEAGELVDLLHQAGIDLVVDIRRYPGSRRHPHFARSELEVWLPRAEIEYRWIEALGGRRPTSAGSRHPSLRNAQFRGYADHMESLAFDDGVGELLKLSAGRSVSVMCSESVWWRCHRRLLADHLVLVEHRPVEHLFHDGHLAGHEPMPEARVDDGVVVYDRHSPASSID